MTPRIFVTIAQGVACDMRRASDRFQRGDWCFMDGASFHLVAGGDSHGDVGFGFGLCGV